MQCRVIFELIALHCLLFAFARDADAGEASSISSASAINTKSMAQTTGQSAEFWQGETPAGSDDNEIVVTASRDHVAPDRRSYDIRSPDTGTLEAEDAIARLPGTIIDIDGKLSILGEKNIRYMMDGEYVTTEMALRLPASLIARIEIVANPGASSGSSSGVVINIVPKKAQGHESKDIIARAQASTLDRREGSLTYQSKNGTWGILASLNARHSSTSSNSVTRDTLPASDFGQPVEISNDSGSSNNAVNSIDATALITRQISGNNTLIVMCQLSRSSQSNDETQVHNLLDVSLPLSSQAVTSRYRFDYLSGTCSQGLKFAQRGNSYSQISFSYGYFNRSTRVSEQVLEHARESEFRFDDHGTSNRFDLTAKRVLDINLRRKFEYGAQYSISDGSRKYFSRNTPIFALQPLPERFDREKHEASGYVSYQFPFRKFDVLSGIRLTSLSLDHFVDGAKVVGGPKHVWLLPSLHVGYKSNSKLAINLAYTAKIQDAAEDYFNPVRVQTGYNQFLQGDGALKIFPSRNYELSMEYSSYKSSLYLRMYVRDKRGSFLPVRDYIGPNQYLSRYVNSTKDLRYGLDVNVKHYLMNSLEFSLDVDLFHQSYRWEREGSHGSGRMSWTAKWNANWQIAKTDALLLIGQYANNRAELGQDRSAELSSSLKYSHDFPHSLSFSVEVLNFLSKDTATVRSQSATLIRENSVRTPQRAVQVSLTKRY